MKRIISLILAVIMMLAVIPLVDLSVANESGIGMTAYAASEKYKTTAALSMRKSANSNSAKLITVPKGVTVLSSGKVSGKYQYVSYTQSGKTYTGWVLKAYLTKVTEPVIQEYTTTAALYLRKSADAKASVILTVPKKTVVTSKDKVSGKYQYVTYTKGSKTYSGWVTKSYLSKVTTKYTTTAALSLRKSADTAAAAILTVPKGATVTSNGKYCGKFQYVSYVKSSKTYSGWVLKAYLQKVVSSASYNDLAKAAYKKTLINFQNGYGLPDKNGKYSGMRYDDLYNIYYRAYNDAYDLGFSYAIEDIDGDKKLELLVSYCDLISDECEVFRYSSTDKKVKYIDYCSPEPIYPNGFRVHFAGHNQGCSYIWPYSCVKNGKTYYVDSFQKNGNMQVPNTIMPDGELCETGMSIGASEYKEYAVFDKDGDGIVYLISSETQTVVCDEAYYVKWVNQATGGTEPMDIAYIHASYKF